MWKNEVALGSRGNTGRPFAELQRDKARKKQRAASAHTKGALKGESGSHPLGLGKGKGRGRQSMSPPKGKGKDKSKDQDKGKGKGKVQQKALLGRHRTRSPAGASPHQTDPLRGAGLFQV